MLNPDFKDMLQCLLDHEVEFLLVGGYALAAHGFPRATKDIDIWVWPNPINAEKLIAALNEFGAPVDQISAQDFTSPGIVFQVGVAPNCIDFITKADGVQFEKCVKNADNILVEGINIPVISRDDLIQNKRSSARPQNIVDADLLDKQS